MSAWAAQPRGIHADFGSSARVSGSCHACGLRRVRIGRGRYRIRHRRSRKPTSGGAACPRRKIHKPKRGCEEPTRAGSSVVAAGANAEDETESGELYSDSRTRCGQPSPVGDTRRWDRPREQAASRLGRVRHSSGRCARALRPWRRGKSGAAVLRRHGTDRPGDYGAGRWELAATLHGPGRGPPAPAEFNVDALPWQFDRECELPRLWPAAFLRGPGRGPCRPCLTNGVAAQNESVHEHHTTEYSVDSAPWQFDGGGVAGVGSM